MIEKAIIVGAGISGLAVAIALRKRKVEVEILEQSPELREVGAAISMAPNCTRILLSFKFDPRRARCVDAGQQYEFNESGVCVDYVDLRKLRDEAGFPWWWIHRADIHAELLRLATNPHIDPSWGPPAAMHLDSRAAEIDCEGGVVVDQQGKRYKGDLVIGADGVRSVVRQAITGKDEEPSVYSGHSAFRCLWDVEALKRDPELRGFVDHVKIQNWVGRDGRRALMYPCRDNTLLNLFCPIPMAASDSVESWRATGKSSDLVGAFKDFPKPLQKLLSIDKNPPLWQIRDRNPVRGWSRGKAVIIGDAAHAMLPHQGQGGAQSIEDAGALPTFLFDAPSHMSLSERLQAFEDFRYPRVTIVQQRSRQQKEPPHPRPGKLPSLEMRAQGRMQVAYDVVAEGQRFLEENWGKRGGVSSRL